MTDPHLSGVGVPAAPGEQSVPATSDTVAFLVRRLLIHHSSDMTGELYAGRATHHDGPSSHWRLRFDHSSRLIVLETRLSCVAMDPRDHPMIRIGAIIDRSSHVKY
jgi:hypothetical protein